MLCSTHECIPLLSEYLQNTQDSLSLAARPSILNHLQEIKQLRPRPSCSNAMEWFKAEGSAELPNDCRFHEGTARELMIFASGSAGLAFFTRMDHKQSCTEGTTPTPVEVLCFLCWDVPVSFDGAMNEAHPSKVLSEGLPLLPHLQADSWAARGGQCHP